MCTKRNVKDIHSVMSHNIPKLGSTRKRPTVECRNSVRVMQQNTLEQGERSQFQLHTTTRMNLRNIKWNKQRQTQNHAHCVVSPMQSSKTSIINSTVISQNCGYLLGKRHRVATGGERGQ